MAIYIYICENKAMCLSQLWVLWFVWSKMCGNRTNKRLRGYVYDNMHIYRFMKHIFASWHAMPRSTNRSAHYYLHTTFKYKPFQYQGVIDPQCDTFLSNFYLNHIQKKNVLGVVHKLSPRVIIYASFEANFPFFGTVIMVCSKIHPAA